MARYYTVIVLFTLLIMASLVSAFTYQADPFRAYHREDISTHGNLIFYFRLIKAQQLRQAPADLLILGSSRAAKIRPALPPGTAGEGYNSALPGLTSYEMLAYLRHANAFATTQRLIVGLDFSVFMGTHPEFRFGFSEHRLAKNANERLDWAGLKQRLLDHYQLLLSTLAITEAVHLTLGNTQAHLNFYRDGTWESNPAAIKLTRKQKFFKIGKQYFELAADASRKHNLEYLRELVRFCYQQEIEPAFFVSPVHALTLVAYNDAGQLAHFLHWQREVLKLLGEEAKAAGRKPFSLYGFQSDVQAFTESIDSPPESPLYIDSIHYSFTYGNAIRAQLLGKAAGPGEKLDEHELEEYWQSVRAELQYYEKANKGLLKQFRKRLSQ